MCECGFWERSRQCQKKGKLEWELMQYVNLVTIYTRKTTSTSAPAASNLQSFHSLCGSTELWFLLYIWEKNEKDEKRLINCKPPIRDWSGSAVSRGSLLPICALATSRKLHLHAPHCRSIIRHVNETFDLLSSCWNRVVCFRISWGGLVFIWHDIYLTVTHDTSSCKIKCWNNIFE